MRPKSRFALINNLRLHYLEWGDRALRPMILLHGTGDNAHMWDYLAPHLCHDFSIIALDQRGHGDSDWAIPPAYACNDYVGDLDVLIESLQLTGVVLLGHSMGALHATRYASLKPALVAGLIHVDIEPCPPPWNKKYLNGLYDSLPACYNSIQNFSDHMAKNSPYADKEFIAYLASHALVKGEDGRYYLKTDREVFNHFDQYDLRPYLGAIQCPTLIIRGKESRVMRQEPALKMSRAIADSKLSEIPKATHQVHTDNTQQFQKTISHFLRQEIYA